MKLRDYGLWYKGWSDDVWTKTPNETSNMYFNGGLVGVWCVDKTYVHLGWLGLRAIGIADNVPGARNWSTWLFPPAYVPADSDFEVLNENS